MLSVIMNKIWRFIPGSGIIGSVELMFGIYEGLLLIQLKLVLKTNPIMQRKVPIIPLQKRNLYDEINFVCIKFFWYTIPIQKPIDIQIYINISIII